MATDLWADSFRDCSVCHYWSERLDAARTHPLSLSDPIGEERRLLTILREHQFEGACVRRVPYLSELATEQDGNKANG